MYNKLTKEKLTEEILCVLKFLYKEDNDRVLVEKDANERCIAARFFAYMMNHTRCDPDYKGLVWDLEYNRKGLQGEPKDMGEGKGLIIPDIVLHHRGYDDRNILVCEFKKRKPTKRDAEKLAYLTGLAYKYRFGVQVVLRLDQVDLVWFKDGCKEPFSYETYNTGTWKLTSPFPNSPSCIGRRHCTLMITRNCNLHCSYCYEPHKCADKSMNMSFEMARKLILQEAKMVGKCAKYKELAIDFMGGEPLMNFPLIKQVVEWLEANPLPIPYICHATTNGTLVKKHEAWLRKHAVTFKLGGSYDGTPGMQRVNRGTDEKFEGNIELLHDIYPELGFHMVISKETLPHLAEGVLSVQRKGYKIKAALAQGVNWNESDAAIFHKQLEFLASAYLKGDKNLKPLNLLTIPLIHVADDPEKVKQVKWCGSGTNMVTYDYDGRAYGCHMFTPIVLGDRAKESKNLDYTCQRSVVDPHCCGCHLKSVCPTCAGFNYRYRGSTAKRDLTWCRMIAAQMKVACIFQIKKLSRLKHFTAHEKMLAKCAYEAWGVLSANEFSVLNEHCFKTKIRKEENEGQQK